MTRSPRSRKSRPVIPSLPVMAELPSRRRRVTRVLRKGNFLDPGEPVEPGVPASLHALPAGTPPDRLGLARWLTDSRNPLTARVAVNRLWSQIFAAGLVETEEDFGTQGEPPSHPELLDWLAIFYQDSGWDTKALLRLIVTSATYRQSSKATPSSWSEDPRNRLLARAPRMRLEAEMVRDQAMALSGLLRGSSAARASFLPSPTGSGRRRSTASAPGRPARAQTAPRAVYVLAADRSLSLDGRLRRPEPRDLQLVRRDTLDR